MNEFNFKQYQDEAMAAKIYDDSHLNRKRRFYALKLFAEIGELIDEITKLELFDKYELTEPRKEKIILKIGGCLWYLASLANEMGIHEVIDYDLDGIGNLEYITYKIGDIICAIHDSPKLIDEEKISRFYSALIQIPKDYNTTISEIAAKNLQKLRERKEKKEGPTGQQVKVLRLLAGLPIHGISKSGATTSLKGRQFTVAKHLQEKGLIKCDKIISSKAGYVHISVTDKGWAAIKKHRELKS